jgi:hypothetical protein
MYTNEAIAAFVPKNNQIDPQYILLIVSTIAKSSKNKKGSLGQGSLNKKKLEKLKLPIPIIDDKNYDKKMQKYLLNHFENSKMNKMEIFNNQKKTTELLNNFDIYLLRELTKKN